MLKYLAIGTGCIVVVALIALAVLAMNFDASRVKSELAKTVLEKKQRTLKIDGELALSFWPSLGVSLGQVSLSERGSDQAFAALESARFSVQLMPLLSKRIVIDQVELIGVRAALLRHQDGTLNIDDLLARDESQTVKLDIAGIKITNARLDWHDEIGAGDLALINLNLSTGHLANAAQGKLELSTRIDGSNHKIDTQIQLRAMYDYDMNGGRFGLSKLDARVTGLLAGMQGVELSIDAGAIRIQPRGDKSELLLEALTLSTKGQEGGDNFEIKLELSGIEGNLQALKVARLGLLLDAKAGATAVTGNLSSSLVANLSTQTMELPRFSGELTVANPQMPMKQVRLPISGTLHADFARQSAEGAASTQFDESKITAKFNLARFTPLALGFAVDIDRLNVDKYLPPRREDSKKFAAKGGEEKPAPQLSGGPALQLSGGPAPQLSGGPVLSTLKNLDLHGTVNIGALQFARAKARNVRFYFKAADGRLKMDKAAS